MTLFMLGWFAACMAGPGLEAHPSCQGWFDADVDGDVDLRDFAEWMNEQ